MAGAALVPKGRPAEPFGMAHACGLHIRKVVTTMLKLLPIAAHSGVADRPSPGHSPTGATAIVDEAPAVEVAEAAFEAFEAGGFPGWSRDWSGTLRSAIAGAFGPRRGEEGVFAG